MSVFSKYWKRTKFDTKLNEIAVENIIQATPIHRQKISCRNGHEWKGIYPVINPEIWEIQYPELIGKPCDCNKCLYGEGMCGCDELSKHWEIRLTENTNI